MRIEVHGLNDIDLHFTISSLTGAISGVDVIEFFVKHVLKKKTSSDYIYRILKVIRYS